MRTDYKRGAVYKSQRGSGVGTRSGQLCLLAWHLWELAILNNMIIKAANVTRKLYVLADVLNRKRVLETEWSLNCVEVAQTFQRWGYPVIDLFATVENKQTTFLFMDCSPLSIGIQCPVSCMAGHVCLSIPPLRLIAKVLCHMRLFLCRLILTAPLGACQRWYPQLLDLPTAYPVKLPV